MVAAFSLMVRFRMAEEGLSESDAGDAVLRDNLFGLELDPRCTQIAAFALALTAWKHGGYRELPLPNVACSGIRLGGTAEDWRKLAKRNGLLQARLEVLRQTFAQAHELGSLIQITAAPEDSSPVHPADSAPDSQTVLMQVATSKRRYTDEAELDAMVDDALTQAAERFGEDDGDAPIFGAAAKQAARAVGLLAGKYHLVITNVPYLGRGNQDEVLRKFCADNYPRAKADLATVFVERCLQFCAPGGSTALVTPQNWLFLGSYASLRGYLLRQKTWDVVARLGAGAFETIGGEVVNVGLFVLTNCSPKSGFVPQREVDPFAAHAEARRRFEELFDKINVPRREAAFGPRNRTLDEERSRIFEAEFDEYTERNPGERAQMEQIREEYRRTLTQSEAHRATLFAGLDVSAPRIPREKAELLRIGPVQMVGQTGQLNNPDARIALDEHADGELLEKYANSIKGLTTGDLPRFILCFWELPQRLVGWEPFLGSVDTNALYAGRESVFYWCNGIGPIQEQPGARTYAQGAWGKMGVLVSQMRHLPVTLYTGEPHDNNTAVIVPHDPAHLPAIWCFCSSPEFHTVVRRIDQKMNVTNATLVKVPFDLERWQKVAAEKYPDGLSEPHSDDPTQWLFDGHPAHATGAQGQPADPLQVAVARLLGYRWPRQTGAEIPGCHLLPDDGLDAHADADGIVCLPPVAGESSAAERLRILLAAGFDDKDQQSATETHTTIERLLAEAGYAGKTLNEWLRDAFFAQHLKRFHNRPFLWHIWDGRKDGFSAIVNYHKLDRAKLEKLTYTYIGDWINRQIEGDRNGDPGANARLVEAQKLQKKLEAILEGEPPYDIYVRWKPLAEQPLGWEPDLNDGVRLNIRPFVEAGVLRVKKPSINWNKDRGTNPDGSERHNDLHYTLARKRAAKLSV